MNRLLLLFALVCATAMRAQNLVPNPSFEVYTECPTDISQLDHVLQWSALNGTPDYYHTCDLTDTVGIPYNVFGYQWAYEGEAYVGIITYLEGVPETYREFIQAQLDQALVPRQTTYISFRVAVGGFSHSSLHCCSPSYTAAGIGLRFSTSSITAIPTLPLDAAVHYADVLMDTSSWTLVSGSFTPDSAYQFVQIGNFLSNGDSHPVIIDPNGDSQVAYTFIDQVCISQTSGICESPTGIPEFSRPRPSYGSFMEGSLVLDLSTLPHEMQQITLMDSDGRMCWQASLLGGGPTLQIRLPHIASGPYVLRVHSANGITHAEKIVCVSP